MPAQFQSPLSAIVDLDGTMVDTVGDFTVALNEMLSELGLPSVTSADVALRVGKGFRAPDSLRAGAGGRAAKP
jgi:phosphoglycolate phosphatase